MGTSQKSMVPRCLLVFLIVVLDILCPSQGLPNHPDGFQGNWLSNWFGQSAGKRNIKDDAFWAARGKRSVGEAQFYAVRGKRQYIKPNGFFQAFPSTDKGIKRTKAFHGIAGKRTMKPNGLFGTFKRAFKPNSLFVIPSKRGLKPNGLFVSIKRSLKPNGLFVVGKRAMLKPNGLFGTIKRSLKPNGLFSLQKRGLKPNGLFGSIKRGLKPNGLFALSKRAPLGDMDDHWEEIGYPLGTFKGYDNYYNSLKEFDDDEDEGYPTEYLVDDLEDEDLNELNETDEDGLDENIMEEKKSDSDFWAARGKRGGIQDADFWATRGKKSKDPDFWAVRGKKSIEDEEEKTDISDEVPQIS